MNNLKYIMLYYSVVKFFKTKMKLNFFSPIFFNEFDYVKIFIGSVIIMSAKESDKKERRNTKTKPIIKINKLNRLHTQLTKPKKNIMLS